MEAANWLVAPRSVVGDPAEAKLVMLTRNPPQDPMATSSARSWRSPGSIDPSQRDTMPVPTRPAPLMRRPPRPVWPVVTRTPSPTISPRMRPVPVPKARRWKLRLVRASVVASMKSPLRTGIPRSATSWLSSVSSVSVSSCSSCCWFSCARTAWFWGSWTDSSCSVSCSSWSFISIIGSFCSGWGRSTICRDTFHTSSYAVTSAVRASPMRWLRFRGSWFSHFWRNVFHSPVFRFIVSRSFSGTLRKNVPGQLSPPR